jgi:hypothetical protein
MPWRIEEEQSMGLARESESSRGAHIRRILGGCLMVFSALGLVISLLGLAAVFGFSGRVASGADGALEATVAALTSTKENLDLAYGALGEARVALGATQTFIDGAGEGLENTSGLMGALSETLVDDLPNVIEDAQHSLSAAEEAAAVIEDLLYGLNAISGLTGVSYDPEVSLTESFARLNESLDALPETLSELDSSLEGAQQNLDDVQSAVSEVSGPLDESELVLAEAQESVQAYSGLIEQLAQGVGGLRASLPSWIRIAVFSTYFLLIWLAISQIGLLWQGWEMVGHQPGLLEDRVRELEEKVQQLEKRRRK